MTIRNALSVIEEMQKAGLVGRYAIAGAVAAYHYVEPALTADVDILVSMETSAFAPASGIVTMKPIFDFLARKGFDSFDKEGIVISGWPVQFLPVANALDAEALDEAVTIEMPPSAEFPAYQLPILRAEHLAATALRLGRPKDTLRLVQFFEEGVMNLARLRDIIIGHGLQERWRTFSVQTGKSWDMML